METKKILNFLAQAKELGIFEETQEILKAKYQDFFQMDHDLFEIYPGRDFKPAGIVFGDIVISKYDAPKQMTAEEAKDFCQGITIGGIKCGVFPDDVDWEQYRDKLNVALLTIGGEPLENGTYITENMTGKALVRPVMRIK